LNEVQHELKEERTRSRELQLALTDMRSRADIAETRLSESEGTNILRNVVLTVVGVILGAATAAYDKLGGAGTVIAVGVGVALIIAVVRSRSKRAGK